jgi:hypothetical protein
MMKKLIFNFTVAALAVTAAHAAPINSQTTLADARETFAEPGGFDYRDGSPALLFDELQLEQQLEARKQEAEAEATNQSAANAEAKKPQYDYQKVVLPIDRVEGGSYTNHSPFVTWVKGENSDRVYPVPPGVTYPWAIDGFADPINRPGEVYKVIDGLHTFYNLVDGEPSIEFSSNNKLAAIAGLTVAQSLKGGWKDANWHAEIRAQTDFGWDNLFEISRPNLASNT